MSRPRQPQHPVNQNPALTSTKTAAPTTTPTPATSSPTGYLVTNSGNVTWPSRSPSLTTSSAPSPARRRRPPWRRRRRSPAPRPTRSRRPTSTTARSPTPPPGDERPRPDRHPTRHRDDHRRPVAGADLDKSASPPRYNVGQVITYTYLLTNSGNVTLARPFTSPTTSWARSPARRRRPRSRRPRRSPAPRPTPSSRPTSTPARSPTRPPRTRPTAAKGRSPRHPTARQ